MRGLALPKKTYRRRRGQAMKALKTARHVDTHLGHRFAMGRPGFRSDPSCWPSSPRSMV